MKPYMSTALDPKYNEIRECKIIPNNFGKGNDGVQFFEGVTHWAKSLKKVAKKPTNYRKVL